MNASSSRFHNVSSFTYSDPSNINIVKKICIKNSVKSKQKKIYWDLGVLLIWLESPYWVGFHESGFEKNLDLMCEKYLNFK
jgi:hypothetical protein